MRYFGILLLIWFASAQARIVSESEPNDGFAEADSIACADTVECAHLDSMSGDFFRLVVPGGDSVYFRTLPCVGDENTVILLYDSTFALLGINDNSGPGLFSTLGVFLQVNQLCYVQVVDPTRSSTGPYTLIVECVAFEYSSNGLCSNARPVTFFPYYDEGSTFGAGNEVGTPSPDVYYELTLATPGDVFVRVCSDAFDSRVQMITHCVGGLMDDASEGECQLGADLFLFGLSAQTYYIMVEGTTASQFGDFTIEISPVLQPCSVPLELLLFTVGELPFLDWLDVPEADYYLIEQASSGEGPFEALAVTNESFWQDPTGYILAKRFYRVRSICE